MMPSRGECGFLQLNHKFGPWESFDSIFILINPVYNSLCREWWKDILDMVCFFDFASIKEYFSFLFPQLQGGWSDNAVINNWRHFARVVIFNTGHTCGSRSSCRKRHCERKTQVGIDRGRERRNWRRCGCRGRRIQRRHIFRDRRSGTRSLKLTVERIADETRCSWCQNADEGTRRIRINNTNCKIYAPKYEENANICAFNLSK